MSEHGKPPTARMEAVREALRFAVTVPLEVRWEKRLAAALAEVEEWEAKLESARSERDRLRDEFTGQRERAEEAERKSELDERQCDDMTQAAMAATERAVAAEAERDEWIKATADNGAAQDAAEAETTRLREALVEMLHLIQTRRTSQHMDGTEMFFQPILARLNQIARAALGETP